MVDSWQNVSWTCLSGLSRRIGQRYGFASVRITASDVALVGGVVHYDLSGKGKGNPIPFSQVHCIGSLCEDDSGAMGFNCSLMEITATEALPCARLYHTATYVGDNQVVVLGGTSFSDKRKLGDMWILTTEERKIDDEKIEINFSGQWTELAPSARSTAFPPPRAQHAATWLGKGPLLLVSGGSGFEETVLGDLWTASIDLKSCSVAWKRVNCTASSPCARRSHALSPLVSECEVMLCGGVDADGKILADLWIAQFLNEEKTRCVWTELVTSPNPRCNGHIIFPSHDNESVLVFGGGGPGEEYNLKSGKWRHTPCPSTAVTAVEIDAIYTAKGDKEANGGFSVPCVLLIGDSVTVPVAPWLASVFAAPIEEAKEEESLETCVSETETQARRETYARLAAKLPCLPGTTTGAVNEPPVSYETLSSPFETVDYLSRSFFSPKESLIYSSWSGNNPNTSHVLITSGSCAFGNLNEFRTFVNDVSTVGKVAQSANSCLLVAKHDDDTFIGFISEALLRHVSSCVSPVVSLNTSSYAEIQATLRLIMVYTPFRSPAVVEDLFNLFAGNSGSLLIDFDSESEHKTPTTGKAVSSNFWYEAIRHRPRGRLEQYAAMYHLHSSAFTINGQSPSTSLFESLKTKLLEKCVHANVAGIGNVLIGKMRNGANLGVLHYQPNGRFVRNVFSMDDDEVDPAVFEVTAIIQADELASDFTQKCTEMCQLFATKNTL